MKFRVTEPDLRSLLTQLPCHLQRRVYRAYAFGSAARNSSNPGDIDIGLVVRARHGDDLNNDQIFDVLEKWSKANLVLHGLPVHLCWWIQNDLCGPKSVDRMISQRTMYGTYRIF